MDKEPPALELTAAVSPEEYRHVCKSLFGYNVAQTAGLLKKPGIDINLLLKDKERQVWGGIFCETWLYSLYIDVLWVDERFRGQGYGRALIEEAERIAREHGCTFAHTTTFSYQAPYFYESVGYTIFASMDDYPEGITQYFLKKSHRPGFLWRRRPGRERSSHELHEFHEL
jgi:GNAT superfamily N-acetyltransferase